MTPRRFSGCFPVFPLALLLLLLAATFSLVGCGDKFSREKDPKDGYTRVVFQGGSSSKTPNLLDDFLKFESGILETIATSTSASMLVIAAKLTDSDPNILEAQGSKFVFNSGFLSNTPGDTFVSWDLPNGGYQFAVLGYAVDNDGGNPPVPTGIIGAHPFCRFVSFKALTGGTDFVSMPTNYGFCGTYPFWTGNSGDSLPTTSLAICSSSSRRTVTPPLTETLPNPFRPSSEAWVYGS